MAVKTFAQGIHPPYNKELTAEKKLEVLPLPERVVIPLAHHIGAPNQPLVEVGDEVKRGQKIGATDAFVSAPVHASISGRVVAVDPVLTLLGQESTAITIESDGRDEQAPDFKPEASWQDLSPERLREIIREAGIVGMGGAMFPTHVKVSVPEDKKIDTMILNGAECEPYLTVDYRLMLERTEEVVCGLKILMKVLEVEQGIIGIEDNKPEAISAMQEQISDEDQIQLEVLETKYPQGGEKLLIKALLDREVPMGGLPLDVGVVVNNTGTALAITRAVREGVPLIERGATVTGSIIAEPKNLLYRIGTPVKDLIDYCGGFKGQAGKVILGGPMMGVAQPNLEIPTMKGTSGVLVLSEAEARPLEPGPCIRCSRCVDACPTHLMPTDLARFSEHREVDRLEDYNVLDCIECGSCSYICPAKIPLVEWIRLGKAEVMAQKKG